MQDLAQDWLAFLGFASEAVNNKKQLFDREKPYYRYIFLRRPNRHAYQKYTNVADAERDSENVSPDPHLMLVAHLSRVFVHTVVPSPQASTKAALARRDIYDRESISPAEEAEILSSDREYLRDRILKVTPLVFADFLGYSLFKVFGPRTHSLGPVLLSNHSFATLANKRDLDSVVRRITGNDGDLHKSDLLLVLWLIFKEAVGVLLTSTWRTSYINARNSTRFILDNRHQIFDEILETDAGLRLTSRVRVYNAGFLEGEGIFDFLRRTIEEQESQMTQEAYDRDK